MENRLVASIGAFILTSTLLNGAQTTRAMDQTEALKSEVQIENTRLPLLTLEQVNNLPIAKAHRFVPESIKSVGDLYMVRGYFDTPQRRMAAGMFLSTDLKTAIYGRGFNSQNAVEYKLFDAESANNNSIITYGNGPQHFYLITDPHCPACKQIEKDLVKYKDTATFHIILIAIKALHPEAQDAIRYIATLEPEKRYEALVSIADGAKPYADMNLTAAVKAEYDEMLMQMEFQADLLGVNGTPSLFDDEGNKLDRNILLDLAPSKLPHLKLSKAE